MTKRRPHMLMILDGWGINPRKEGNAVRLADTPVLDKLLQQYPHTHLLCSGEAVGLPNGVMGNSEVGHLNIGAGRVVYQDLVRINRDIQDGAFFENKALRKVMDTAKAGDKALHLMGLVSDGGVHSHMDHLKALIDMAARKGLAKVFIHVILDGRDTPPDSGLGFVSDLHSFLQAFDGCRIGSICGRYYAMDRDKRWDRTELAYRLYTAGEGVRENDPVAAVKNAYGRGETDEFVKPVIIAADDGPTEAVLQDGDGVIFFNFRADRARQITHALNDDIFDGFERPGRPQLGGYVCMALYEESFDLPLAYPPVHLDQILGAVLSSRGCTQLRIAETEKYAHVTYFFNGGEEKPFPSEDRCLIPSPRDIPTYDHKPQMSALAVKDNVIERINSGKYDFIALNFANMDMVGHTGVLEAAIKACETVDRCVGEIVEAVLAQNGVLLVTADHGNAEQMLDGRGNIHTAHTLNQVPLILVDQQADNVRLQTGILGDLAPTILHLMGIPQPAEMTGRSLIESGVKS